MFEYIFEAYGTEDKESLGEFSFLFETDDPQKTYPTTAMIRAEMIKKFPSAINFINKEVKKVLI